VDVLIEVLAGNCENWVDVVVTVLAGSCDIIVLADNCKVAVHDVRREVTVLADNCEVTVVFAIEMVEVTMEVKVFVDNCVDICVCVIV